MSTPVVFNTLTYNVPVQGDLRWGPELTRYLVALGTYSLAPSGGNFTLTGNVNFGASFGLLAAYFSGRGTVASAGLLRLAKTDVIDWKNNAGSGNNVLAVDSSDNLTWNGTIITTGLTTLADGKIWIGSAANLPVAQTLTGDVTTTNAGVTSITADSIVNADINSTAAIAYSKLNLTGSIINTDIFSAAAIALTKLAALSASVVPVTNGSGFITSSSVTATTLSYLDATSSIQTQIDSKQATGNYITALTGDVTASGPGSVAATLATVNSAPGSTTISSITTNGKGLVTANSSASTTGSGNVVLATSPTLTTPALGTPSALVLTNATGLLVTGGGTGLSSVTQGDILYASASNTLTTLAKNTTATRYLSNTGTSNNPAWAQVDLTNGITGTLPVANGGTGLATTTAYGLIAAGTTSTGNFQNVGTPGASGTVLTSTGTASLPTWQAATGTGTVNTGTAGRVSVYPSTGTTVDDTYTQNTHPIDILIATQASRSADLEITIPNPGNAVTATNIMLTDGAQTVNGAITMAAAIAMGTNKITGLGNGSAAQDAAAFGQVPIFTNWTVFTPTGAWTTNTTYTGYRRRVGSVMECFIHIALAGAPTAAALTITVPASLSINTGIPSANQYVTQYGEGGGSQAGAYKFFITYDTSTTVQVLYQSATTGAATLVDATHPVVWANGSFLDLHFSIPISTWTEFT